ncbi:protein ABHD14A isoform X6 [Macaca fascicularis]|uniref:protein ABHD14A isoform X6 n=1 Tax=Macaca fascicularis TaxID=9541 RepID=UPI003D154002
MVGALCGCWFRLGGARRLIPFGPTVVQTSMSRSQVALLGLGLLLIFLLYVGLPGPPEQNSWFWGDPNVTVLAGLTPGNSPIFYREVLPLNPAHRFWELGTFKGGKHRGRAGSIAGAGAAGPGGTECRVGEPLAEWPLCPALPDARPPPATWIRAHCTHLHPELHPGTILGCEDSNPYPVWRAGPHPGSRVTAAAPPPAQPLCGEATQRGPCLLPPQAARLPPCPACLP